MSVYILVSRRTQGILQGYAISLCRPIHDAIEIGSLDLVKLLIDHNADLMVEYGERTAVEFAIDQDQIEIAEYIKGGQSRHVQYIVMHTLELV